MKLNKLSQDWRQRTGKKLPGLETAHFESVRMGSGRNETEQAWRQRTGKKLPGLETAHFESVRMGSGRNETEQAFTRLETKDRKKTARPRNCPLREC